MKPNGSKSEYADCRAESLLREYRRYLLTTQHINMGEAFAHAARQPAPQFFISTRRASKVITAMEKGASILSMRANKRAMFEEIFRRYCELRNLRPGDPTPHLVREVISQPAPSHYVSAFTAKIIILHARKQWHRERFKKLQAFSSR
ncbi:MAG: hypothetical protein K2I18_08545 [Paramuribaculum sp.]|nr:hypothetical protein [Paramuribaculum sp.]